MRNIFLFIRRYFNFLLFVLLQVICLYFIVRYSKYHQAAFGETANQVTGKINARYNNIEYYFHLKRTNDSLLQANERLYNKLKENYNLPDSVRRSFIDSIRVDSIYPFRQLNFRTAKVVANSVNLPNNFLVLSKGSSDGFHRGMGVISETGAVIGIITDLSEDFSVVMSLLHKDSKISGKLLKSGETGTVSWDGEMPNIAQLTGVPKSVKVNKGDSIVTSGFSTTFPKGMLLGRVESASVESGSGYLKIKMRTAANFNNIQFAYVIENFHADAINKLLDKALKQP